MKPVLKTLEPTAMDLWSREITDCVLNELRPSDVVKSTYLGGLYQKVVMVR